MAKASVETVEIQPAVPAVVEEWVTLTLSRDEAEVLLSLVGKCAFGGPAAPVYDALKRAGITGAVYKVTTHAYSGRPVETISLEKRGD